MNLKEKPDWLFERNPVGAVPILEHKGRVVYESAVCEEFLEEAFPASVSGPHALLPSCPYERAAVRLLMLKFDKVRLFMVALWNRADHYIFALWFLSSSVFFSFLA